MSHIFDTNTFSEAHKLYYPLDVVVSYWREVSDPAGWEVEHGPADLVLTVQQLDSAD